MQSNVFNNARYISSFRINSEEIKIYLVPDIVSPQFYYGLFYPEYNHIFLNETELSASHEGTWLRVLWHEICHAIHSHIRYKDQYDDEMLTDLLARAFVEACIYDMDSEYNEFSIFGSKVIIENHYRNEVDYNYNIIYADLGGRSHDEKLIFKLKLILRFILYKYGYEKLSYDEQYLNLFSRALYQVIRSSSENL